MYQVKAYVAVTSERADYPALVHDAVSEVTGDWPPAGESASELFCDINVGCYGHITTSYNWNTGRTKCQQAGGDLASLDTVEKLRFACDHFS